MKRAIKSMLGALAVAAGLSFLAAPAHAVEGWGPSKVDIGGGVMCDARVGGTTWPANGVQPLAVRYFYCGTSTAPSRGSEVWLTLKGPATLEPTINTLMTNNFVIVYQMTGPAQYAQAIGANAQTVWNNTKGKAAFSLFTADGDPHNAIVVYENSPSGTYPNTVPITDAIRGHDALHEMGHLYDRLSGTLSNSTIFSNLYPDDKTYEANHNPNHATDSVLYAYWWNSKSELFAELFAIVFNSLKRPVDQPTFDYFQCTKQYVKSRAKDQVNPPANSYPGAWCTP